MRTVGRNGGAWLAAKGFWSVSEVNRKDQKWNCSKLVMARQRKLLALHQYKAVKFLGIATITQAEDCCAFLEFGHGGISLGVLVSVDIILQNGGISIIQGQAVGHFFRSFLVPKKSLLPALLAGRSWHITACR